MIRGYVALIRQLRAFMEQSGLPWGAVKLRCDRDDDGRTFYDDARAEIEFKHHGRDVGVVIWAPSADKVDGTEPMPLGKLAARCDGHVVKGPIDPATWNQIVKLINHQERL